LTDPDVRSAFLEAFTRQIARTRQATEVPWAAWGAGAPPRRAAKAGIGGSATGHPTSRGECQPGQMRRGAGHRRVPARSRGCT